MHTMLDETLHTICDNSKKILPSSLVITYHFFHRHYQHIWVSFWAFRYFSWNWKHSVFITNIPFSSFSKLQCLSVTERGRRRGGNRGEGNGDWLRGGHDWELHDHGPVWELSPGGCLHPEEYFIWWEACDTDQLEWRHWGDILPEGPAEKGWGEGLTGSERGMIPSGLEKP